MGKDRVARRRDPAPRHRCSPHVRVRHGRVHRRLDPRPRTGPGSWPGDRPRPPRARRRHRAAHQRAGRLRCMATSFTRSTPPTSPRSTDSMWPRRCAAISMSVASRRPGSDCWSSRRSDGSPLASSDPRTLLRRVAGWSSGVTSTGPRLGSWSLRTGGRWRGEGCRGRCLRGAPSGCPRASSTRSIRAVAMSWWASPSPIARGLNPQLLSTWWRSFDAGGWWKYGTRNTTP